MTSTLPFALVRHYYSQHNLATIRIRSVSPEDTPAMTITVPFPSPGLNQTTAKRQGTAMATTYDELVRLCTNGSAEPYDYQRRIAAEGLPDLLNVPTGAGKTMAVVLGWLYRRRFHPDLAVRAATPHWLVICQPMRTLVEQVRTNAKTWIDAAGLTGSDDPLNLFVFMGGEPTAENDWRLQVHQDAIIGAPRTCCSRGH